MRPTLFGKNLSGMVNSKMAQHLPTATLHKITVTPNTTTLTGAPTEAEKKYTCRALLSSYTEDQMDGTTVQRGDRKALILGGSLPDNVDPEPNDRLTAEDQEWQIVHVTRDPAAATFTCQVRR